MTQCCMTLTLKHYSFERSPTSQVRTTSMLNVMSLEIVETDGRTDEQIRHKCTCFDAPSQLKKE